jgi:hypothetical protein
MTVAGGNAMTQSLRQKIGLHALRPALAWPEFFPLTIDFEKNLMWFARLRKETCRRAVILGPEHIRCGRLACSIRLEDLLLYDAQVPVWRCRILDRDTLKEALSLLRAAREQSERGDGGSSGCESFLSIVGRLEDTTGHHPEFIRRQIMWLVKYGLAEVR